MSLLADGFRMRPRRFISRPRGPSRYRMIAVRIGMTMLVVALIGSVVGAAEASEKTKAGSAGQSMTVYGKISVKGSMPHIYLCLTTPEGVDYRLVGPLKERLERDFQQQHLQLDGEVVNAALGPGFPAVFQVHTILDVK
jgi:hypothetical protein